MYFEYFGVKIGDQEKSWAPHGVCLRCVEGLRMWSKGKVKFFRFGVPMIWREPRNHSDDCYYCTCNVQGYSTKNKKQIFYPNMDSALNPVPHTPGIPTPQAPQSLDNLPSSESESEESSSDEFQVGDSSGPQQFSQGELNDLIQDLGLPRQSVELLGSRLQEKNLLTPGTAYVWYRNREKHFEAYISGDG